MKKVLVFITLLFIGSLIAYDSNASPPVIDKAEILKEPVNSADLQPIYDAIIIDALQLDIRYIEIKGNYISDEAAVNFTNYLFSTCVIA